jgi:protein-S-isoprenylcysteine O-methyltransferase Ste14
MVALMLLGASLAVGSGIVSLMFSVRMLFIHFRILGEERACLEQNL